MDPNDDDMTNEALIRALCPQNDQALEEELQQVTQNKGLYPRGLKHEKIHFKEQDIKIVTASKQNTKLFSSRVSQRLLKSYGM